MTAMSEVLTTCAWCGERIPEGHEVFAVGGKAREGVALKDREGKSITLSLALTDRRVQAIVVTSDSEAKKAGNDLMFVVCSPECGQSLKEAVQQGIDFIDSARMVA